MVNGAAAVGRTPHWRGGAGPVNCPAATKGHDVTGRVSIGENVGLEAHPLRAPVLAEIHARPFTLVDTPRRFLHFAFLTDPDQAAADRAALARFLNARGQPAPEGHAKYHRAALGGAALRWEQHSEFTTYTWELPSEGLAGVPVPFHPAATVVADPMRHVPQPGPLVVAIDLHLIADAGSGVSPERLFDRASLCRATVYGGAAEIATDFQTDPAGFVRLLVLDKDLGPARAGALVLRLIEVETYRTLALLGLPEAQRLAPQVRRIETALVKLTEDMRGTESLEDNNRLLDELTNLAAELEAGAAASSFRFGASRAYDEIVYSRLSAVEEQPLPGFPTWSSFLSRRMKPAMRTCQSIQDRQVDLSNKLTRAADLLRTGVDIALQQQNRDLLESMNRRSRQQLRLQQTVEGLSIAAVSYYVIGLFGYVAKGAKDYGLPVDPSLATALAVPLVVGALWLIVRRLRRRHGDMRG